MEKDDDRGKSTNFLVLLVIAAGVYYIVQKKAKKHSNNSEEEESPALLSPPVLLLALVIFSMHKEIGQTICKERVYTLLAISAAAVISKDARWFSQVLAATAVLLLLPALQAQFQTNTT